MSMRAKKQLLRSNGSLKKLAMSTYLYDVFECAV
jgi:hypothetical protein